MTPEETYAYVYNRDHGECRECDRPLSWFDGELAHKIPQSDAMLRKYGKKIIHHQMNMDLVCRGSSTCNDARSISAHYEQERELVAAIRADLARETEI